MACIYGLIDPRTGETRYIGKANCPEKRLSSHMRDSRRRDTPVYRWIRKVGKPGLTILAECEGDWRPEERRLIAEARARGDRLLNLADGGDEPSCPQEVRARNGKAVAVLRVQTPEARRLYELKRMLGIAMKRGHVSETTRAKMREAARTRPDVFGAFADA